MLQTTLSVLPTVSKANGKEVKGYGQAAVTPLKERSKLHFLHCVSFRVGDTYAYFKNKLEYEKAGKTYIVKTKE